MNKDIVYKLFDNARLGDLEAKEKIYKRYYYIVEKVVGGFDTSEYDKVIKVADEIYLDAINDYCSSKYQNKYNVSSFINDRFRFINHIIHPELSKKHEKDEFLNKYAVLAFEGDLEARDIIYYKYCYIAENCACELYKKYMTTVNDNLDDTKLNLYINLDDIRQEFYLLLWRYINNFYNDLNNNREGKYISMSIHVCMQYYYDKKVREINNLFVDDYLEELTDSSINADYKSIEINDLFEIIESNMCSSLKGVLSLIKQGYSYKEIAHMYGLTTSRIGQIIDESKKIVNDKNLSYSNL